MTNLSLLCSCGGKGPSVSGSPGGILLITHRPLQTSHHMYLSRLIHSVDPALPIATVVLPCGVYGYRDEFVPDHMILCWEEHYPEILKQWNPTVALALGSDVLYALTRKKVGLEKSRCKLIEFPIPLYVTYHPNALMKAPARTKTKISQAISADLKMVVRGEKELVTPRPVPSVSLHSPVVLDFETTGLRPWRDKLVRAGYGGKESLPEVAVTPNTWAVPEGWEVWGWNLAFDSQWDPEILNNPWVDGMVLHGVLYPEAASRSLKVVGPQYSGVPYSKVLSDGLSPDELDQYLAMDIWQTHQAIEEMLRELDKHPSKSFVPWIMRLTRGLSKAAYQGVKIDRQVVQSKLTHHYEAQESCVSFLQGIADQFSLDLGFKPKGNTFTRSNKALQKLVYNCLGLPPIRTKKGNLALGKEAVARLAGLDRLGVLQTFGKFLQHQSKVTKIYEPLTKDEYVDPQDFMHPSPRVVRSEGVDSGEKGGTVTGRVSWKDLPVQTWEGEDKEVVVSRWEDGRIVSVDLSQAEPRLVAYLSQDPTLLHAFQNNLDFYRVLMGKILKCEPEEVSKELRQAGKTIYLAILYGAGAEKIKDIFQSEAHLSVPLHQCQDLIDAFPRDFKKLTQWSQGIKEKVVRGEYCMTPTGRARKFQQSDDPGNIRQAINFHPQSFASDINHALFLSVQDCGNPGIIPMVTVHDSCIYDVESEELVPVIKEVYDKLDQVVHHHFGVWLNVPIRYEMKVGRCWL